MKLSLFLSRLLLSILFITCSLATYAQLPLASDGIVKPVLFLNPGPYDTICAGTRVIFSAISVAGGNHPRYEWRKNGALVKNAIDDTYATDDLHNGDIVSCTLTKPLGNTRSVSVNTTTTIAVHNIPEVAIVNTNSPRCEGDSIYINAYAIDSHTIYNWTGPAGFKAATTSQLTLSKVNTDAEGYYKVTASLYGCNSAPDSTYIIVNARVQPQVNLIPAPSGSVCQGTPVSFSAAVQHGGNAPQYQWLKNNAPIPGATNNSYLEMNTLNGDSITLLLSSNAICPVSKEVSATLPIIVNPLFTPAVSINSNAGSTIVHGAPVTFTANSMNENTTPAYQWKRNGINISGARNRTYTTDNINANDIFSVSISSNNQCAYTDTASSNRIAMKVLPAATTVAEVGISLYPNPGNGNFAVRGVFPGAKEANIEVISVIGQSVFKQEITLVNGQLNKQINIEAPNGIYMLRCKVGEESFAQRIIIKR